MVLGLRAGEAGAVVPFDYSRLLYATAIIVASELYIAMQKARR